MSVVADRRRTGVSGALIIIGIGLLIVTGWWWPGIMIVLGIAIGAERLYQGRYLAAATVTALFIAIPLAISVAEHIHVPGTWVAGFVLVSLGIVTLVRVLGSGARPGNPPAV